MPKFLMKNTLNYRIKQNTICQQIPKDSKEN